MQLLLKPIKMPYLSLLIILAVMLALVILLVIKTSDNMRLQNQDWFGGSSLTQCDCSRGNSTLWELFEGIEAR